VPAVMAGIPPSRSVRVKGSLYGVTVKLVTPGPPGALDQGPHPASEPDAHVAPVGHARTIPLYTVPPPLPVKGTCARSPGVTPLTVALPWPNTATKYSYNVAPGTGDQPNWMFPDPTVLLCAGDTSVGAVALAPDTLNPCAGPVTWLANPGFDTTRASYLAPSALKYAE